MRALLQRVSYADVTVDGKTTGAIGPGLLILFGAGEGDGEEQAEWLAKKAAALRIFSDEEGKMNRSVKDIGGSILVVSQFTLYADCRRGTRPGFSGACEPEKAEQLYEYFCRRLQSEGVREVQTGIFGADMKVSLTNDGPVTILLEREPSESR